MDLFKWIGSSFHQTGTRLTTECFFCNLKYSCPMTLELAWHAKQHGVETEVRIREQQLADGDCTVRRVTSEPELYNGKHIPRHDKETHDASKSG